MEKGLVVIGVAWMVVLGTFDSSSSNAWHRFAIEVPGLAPQKQIHMIGGWTW